MDTTLVMTISAILTLFSVILKFTRLKMENVSIFLQIKKKSDAIQELISKKQKTGGEELVPQKRLLFALSDWFSTLAIVTVSSIIFFEYSNFEALTHANLLHISFLFSLLLFNIIIIAVSTIERRLGYWIDEFINTFDQILILLPPDKKQESRDKPETPPQSPGKKSKRRAGKKAKK
jgi:hypothetical protein